MLQRPRCSGHARRIRQVRCVNRVCA
jgi:hypothetical protein